MSTKHGNGETAHVEDSAADPQIQAAFTQLAKLEADFAAVELDALRQKEYSMRELYKRRHEVTSQIPDFWQTVLTTAADSGPEDPLNLIEGSVVPYIKSLQVERYQIKSGSEGEPRSLRFMFEFEENDFFEDKIVVKDFEFRAEAGETGGLASTPITFTWKKGAKKSGMNKLLDAASDLYKAEQVLVSDSKLMVEQQERESLWQYEKLNEAIERAEEDEDRELSFLDWFGFRGSVNIGKGEAAVKADNDDAEEDEDSEDDGMLDVEIFPAGADLAIAIADELWPNVMDAFIAGQAEDDLDDLEDDEDDEDEDVPELVGAADDFEGFDGSKAESKEEEEDKPPKKKQKKA